MALKACVLSLILCFGFASEARSHDKKKPRRVTCSRMAESKDSCMMDYKDPVQEKRCEVCREKGSCFIKLDGVERGLCEAYKEGKSCFMALNGTDRAWCEVLKEDKTCAVLKGKDFDACEEDDIPKDHAFWSE